METFSALLAICAGNSPVPGEFPAQRPVTRSFDVFFDLRLNKRLSKQSWGWWFETQSGALWRHRNVTVVIFGTRRSSSLPPSDLPTHNQSINQASKPPTNPNQISLLLRNDSLHLSTHLYIHTLTHVFNETFTQWRSHSSIRSFTLTISHIHSLTWSVTFDHALTNALTHWFTQTFACPHNRSHLRGIHTFT